MKTIIKLKDTDVVSIDGNILTIESNKSAVTANVVIDGQEILDKVIEQLQKENTTTENSDVACWNTSDNPMTRTEWDAHRNNNQPVFKND